MKKLIVLTVALLAGFYCSVNGQAFDYELQNESPYFLIENEVEGQIHFPLLGTKVHATILGPVADVVVEQTYQNEGAIPIEATYIFPASTRAAVYEMQIIIGKRTIKAEIQEKNQAKRNYEKAKQAGKRSSLLSQDRANVFRMQVANIMPGEMVQVILRYNEFIIPEEQIYTFVYPTVVGPRYVSQKNKGSDEQFAANPYLREGNLSIATFDMTMDIRTAQPLEHVNCSTHKIKVNFQDKNKVHIRLRSEELHGGNRDFIFDYQLSEEGVSGGTILYEHHDEKFFLTTIEPPKAITDNQVLPREYIFVLDVSGSMSGFPISTTKTLMKDLILSLRADDVFNVLLFAGDNQLLSESSLSATPGNLEKAFNIIDQLQGAGGTELLPALERILSMPKHCSGLSRSIVIVTDGYITVEPQVFDLITKNLSDANVFTFGIGGAVNRLLLEGMAHVGRGEAFIVTKPEFANQQARRFKKYIDRPVLSNIQIAFQDFETYDVVPAFIPDLMAERPIYIFGKYRGEAKGKLKITGVQKNKEFNEEIKIEKSQIDSAHLALRYLWARENIRLQHDFNQLSSTPERVTEITNLGLKYNLLTDYTSFLAIDESEIVNSDGLISQVRQILPLPEGVSNYAIGFEMGVEGISQATPRLDTLLVVPQVLDDLPASAKSAVEKVFADNMHLWCEEKVQYHLGKIMEITLAEKITEIRVTLGGTSVDELSRRDIMLLLERLRWPKKKGEKLHIKFATGISIRDMNAAW